MATNPLADVQHMLSGGDGVSTVGPEGFHDAKPNPDEPSPSDPLIPGTRRRGRPRKDDPTAPSNQAKSRTSKATAPGAVAPKAEIPMPPAGTIAKAMSELYGFAGFGLMAIRPQTATAVMANADSLGQAWEAAAASNPAVRAMLVKLMGTSTVGVLVAAHVPIILTLLNENSEIKAKSIEAKEKEAELSRGLYAVPPESERC